MEEVGRWREREWKMEEGRKEVKEVCRKAEKEGGRLSQSNQGCCESLLSKTAATTDCC